MNSWIMLSILTLLFWGCWGFFAALTTRYISAGSALIWEVAGAALVATVVLIWLVGYRSVETTREGVIFGVMTGVTYTTGLILLFFAFTAISRESVGTSNTNTIIIITALYPVVSVFLNVLILGTPVSPRMVTGALLGITGVIILLTGN